MDKCFKKKEVKNVKRAGLRRLFLLNFFMIILLASHFSQGIPWSLESEFVSYVNAPLEWTKGFQNIHDLQQFVTTNHIIERNQAFIQSLSKQLNCDLSIIEELFRSKLIVIGNIKDYAFFDEIERYIFDLERLYMLMLEGLGNGILIIEYYQGLEELLEIISSFEVKITRQGEYLIASTNTNFFSEYQNKLMTRNVFSDDILIYAEAKEKNLTVTNAFSFLNIELKSLNAEEDISQFPVQIVEIPLEFEFPNGLFVFANHKAKEFFYSRFEVISSIDEWQIFYDLIDSLFVYGFYYEQKDQWLIGFKSHHNFYDNESFRNQISKWGFTQSKTIKPFANSYYLSVVEDYFMISNFKPDQTIDNLEKGEIALGLKELQEKTGNREVYEAGYEWTEVLGFPYYFFSSIDDKIGRQVIRIF